MEFAEQGFLRYEENGQKQGKGDKNQGKGNIDRKQWNEGKKDEYLSSLGQAGGWPAITLQSSGR